MATRRTVGSTRGQTTQPAPIAGTTGKTGTTWWGRMNKQDLTLDRLAELMAREKAAANASRQTVTGYLGTVRRYGAWLDDQDLPAILAHFTLEHVQRYILDLRQQRAWEYHAYMTPKDKTLSDHTVNSYTRALRSFSTWLRLEGYTHANVLGRLKVPKTTTLVQDILTTDEIRQVVNGLNPHTESSARDQAIFLLLLDTCMRAGELCSFTIDVFHLDKGYVYVLGKGKTMRPMKVGRGRPMPCAFICCTSGSRPRRASGTSSSPASASRPRSASSRWAAANRSRWGRSTTPSNAWASARACPGCTRISFGSLTEFERGLIAERAHAGLAPMRATPQPWSRLRSQVSCSLRALLPPRALLGPRALRSLHGTSSPGRGLPGAPPGVW